MIEPTHLEAVEAVLVEAVACHLCDDAAQLLANAESEGKLRDRRIALESEEGKAIARATRAPMPPIVLINGEFFMQMAKLEADGGLAKAGVTIVPVVMNSSSQVAAELQRYGIRTPYLVDPNGSVSNLYKTLGTGHHASLPATTSSSWDPTAP